MSGPFQGRLRFPPFCDDHHPPLLRPFQRAPFFPLGGRSTAIKVCYFDRVTRYASISMIMYGLQLKNGTVWLLASTPADMETLNKLREIGNVQYERIVMYSVKSTNHSLSPFKVHYRAGYSALFIYR